MIGNGDLTGARGHEPYSVADIDAWLQRAQPLAQLCYLVGVYAGGADDPLNAHLQAQEARGLLHLVQRRHRRHDGGPGHALDYLAVRSSRPWTPGTGRAPPPLPRLAAQAAATARWEREFA